MKALIFDSGLGSRLGHLTSDRPKAMVRLNDGESLFERQVRILRWCGIRDFVVTTGPYPEQMKAVTERYEQSGCTFTYVSNDMYATTNCIYSFYLAQSELAGDDFIVIHGDLVFDRDYAAAVVESASPCVAAIDTSADLPTKDFKARIDGNRILEISVSATGSDCCALQPFYKVSEHAMSVWIDAVNSLIATGKTDVYAETALNTVLNVLDFEGLSYRGHFVAEVDTSEDLALAAKSIPTYDYAQQPVKTQSFKRAPLGDEHVIPAFDDVRSLLQACGISKPLIVAGGCLEATGAKASLDEARVSYAAFRNFQPNPTSKNVRDAIDAFVENACDGLISVGGGSAIDVAKCIQSAFLPACPENPFSPKTTRPQGRMPHIACPTTAGTGSESTHFAVCYHDGKKCSIDHEALLPDIAILDPDILATLPVYQKKCTLLDALCQAIESYWSTRADDTSRAYAAHALTAIRDEAASYLQGSPASSRAIMHAANDAGKAINLTYTTAAHAMSYGLTSRYGIPHGHAVALCLPGVWRILIERWEDGRQILADLASYLCNSAEASPEAGLAMFVQFSSNLGLESSLQGNEQDVEQLTATINAQRMATFPLDMSPEDIANVYRPLFR